MHFHAIFISSNLLTLHLNVSNVYVTGSGCLFIIFLPIYIHLFSVMFMIDGLYHSGMPGRRHARLELFST
jgi:hypothetical protein